MWDKIALQVLDTYGFTAFFVLIIVGFFGWMIVRKDNQIIEMGKSFRTSFDANTEALHQIKETEIKLAEATDKFQEWLRDAAEKTAREHEKILDKLAVNAR